MGRCDESSTQHIKAVTENVLFLKSNSKLSIIIFNLLMYDMSYFQLHLMVLNICATN